MPTANQKPEERSLAQRISGWTSNLLATGIVLAAALGLGRQLVQWWSVDESQVGGTPPFASSRPFSEQTATLEFGNAGHLVSRETSRGPRDAVLARLRASCRRTLEVGTEQVDPSSLANLKASERAFLERAAAREPIEQAPGRWQLHQYDGTFPIVVGIGLFPASASENRGSAERPLAEPARRVLAWSLAAPAGGNEWTLYTWRAGQVGQAGKPDLQVTGQAREGGTAEVPLPPGSRRTLTLGNGADEATLGFAGNGDPRAWQQHFDRVAADRGCARGDWQATAGSWRLSYRTSVRERETAIDVHFSEHSGSELVGLVIITRSPAVKH